jgi:hypothetical protein
MKYERFNDTYPEYGAIGSDGKPQLSFGWFGYPAEMLHMAVVRDDVPAFKFYWERYFDLSCPVWTIKYTQTLVEYATNFGGKNVAKELRKMGAK